MVSTVDTSELGRRMMVHEARVQETGERTLRDLGDGWLLHDGSDAEPFWNRLVAPRWPDEARAFDRRLDEVLVLFASLARVPHVRPLPAGNRPPDLATRLAANGFGVVGADVRMVLADPAPCVARARAFARLPPGRLEVAVLPDDARGPGSRPTAAPPGAWAADAARILAEAFGVDPARGPSLEADLLGCAARPECRVLVAYEDGIAVACARATTVDGGTYLSSIATRPAWQGRGHGGLVTALAVAAGVAWPGAPLIHLAVESGNARARRLYERLGFRAVGEPVPDLLMR